MKNKLLTLLIALIASVGTMFAWDYEGVKIGGLYYNLNRTNQTAEVTYRSYTYTYNEGWGITTANIPASVTYNSVSYSVTSIGGSAFLGCSGLTSVTIPNSVTSIGGYAFDVCSGLTSVTIPNSVTSIGDYAFYNCTGLTSVEIPNSVTSIGSYAFHGCSGLTSVEIPNSVTSIGSYAFLGCSGLTSPLYNAHVFAFMPITYAGSYAIPDAIEIIAIGAFSNCSGLTSIDIPNSVTSIGSYAFHGCSGLTSVTIPNSVISIGFEAFSGCSSLTSITIPSSVTSIAGRAFWNCSSLNAVHINNIAAWCNIQFYYTFSGYYHLYLNNTEVLDLIIPNTVTNIGAYAFLRCSSLTSVTIPNSVTSIGDGAFQWCKGLTSVTCLAATPPSLGTDVFASVDCSKVPLYVPAGRVAAYKTGVVWWKFNPIVPVQVQAEAMPIEEDAMIRVGTDSVKLKWFSVDGAATYTIEEHGTRDTLRMFTLDAQGQLQGIRLDTMADNETTNAVLPSTTDGWQYILTSLDINAEYTYVVTARDENGVVLCAQTLTPREELQPEVHTWTLAGIPDIFGSNWEPEDTNNDMVLQEDGTFKWEKDDLALTVGSISFAVCYDHSQNISYPSGNYVLEIQETGTYTITITFNPETHDIIATATKISGDAPLPEVHTWTIVGGSPAFGSQWDIENTNNDMLLQEDGTYKWERTNQELSAETIEFKICYDHGWTSVYPSDNYVLAIQEAGTYTITITFNPETHDIIATATKEIPQMNTCAEVNANTEQNVEMALGEVTVLYVRLPHIYVQDNTATTLIYSNQYANLQAGDHVQGIVGLAKSFRGLPELAPTTPFADLIISSDGAPQIEDAVTIPSMNDINRVMMLRRVNMPDATFPSSKTTIYGTFMGAELAFVNYWKDSYTFNSTKTYDILGCVGNYNGELQIYVSEITETPTSSETPTGMKDINHTNITATKKMINGQLYILRGQKTYTLHGQEVR